LVRLPPSPTLFPYTTLFRSMPPTRRKMARHAPVRARQRNIQQVLADRSERYRLHHHLWANRHARAEQDQELRERRGCQERLRQADRKSTRLNSSHVKISYAV